MINVRIRDINKRGVVRSSIIVGIGNIYVDEILFLSKINPWRKAEH